MSLENSKTDFTRHKYSRVDLEQKVRLEIPDKVLYKIQYLCKSIPRVEWSGALFYSIKGSIRNLKKCRIVLEDILPLDMGSAAYTEYTLDKRFVDYIEEDFDTRANWKLGHIHSHNVMRK